MLPRTWEKRTALHPKNINGNLQKFAAQIVIIKSKQLAKTWKNQKYSLQWQVPTGLVLELIRTLHAQDLQGNMKSHFYEHQKKK